MPGGNNRFRRRFHAMTSITHQLAATHDHWFEKPAAQRAIPGVRLWWRHLAKTYPLVADALEWTGASAVAVGLFLATLIANA